MKKFLIALVIIILVGGIYWFIPKATVEKPLIVSAQLDSTTKTIDITYIVNKKNPTFIESFTYGEFSYYNEKINPTLAMDQDETKVLTTQNGLELRELKVFLSDERMKLFEQQGVYVFMTEFMFKSYEPMSESIIYIPNEVTEAEKYDKTTIRYTYVAEVEETIEIIGHYEKQSTISYEQNGKQVNLPVNLMPGDKLEIYIHDPYQLSSKHQLLLEIVKGNGEIVTKQIALTFPIPKGYLKKLVEEHEQGI